MRFTIITFLGLIMLSSCIIAQAEYIPQEGEVIMNHYLNKDFKDIKEGKIHTNDTYIVREKGEGEGDPKRVGDQGEGRKLKKITILKTILKIDGQDYIASSSTTTEYLNTVEKEDATAKEDDAPSPFVEEGEDATAKEKEVKSLNIPDIPNDMKVRADNGIALKEGGQVIIPDVKAEGKMEGKIHETKLGNVVEKKDSGETVIHTKESGDVDFHSFTSFLYMLNQNVDMEDGLFDEFVDLFSVVLQTQTSHFSVESLVAVSGFVKSMGIDCSMMIDTVEAFTIDIPENAEDFAQELCNGAMDVDGASIIKALARRTKDYTTKLRLLWLPVKSSPQVKSALSVADSSMKKVLPTFVVDFLLKLFHAIMG